jgi:hypothetical protein
MPSAGPRCGSTLRLVAAIEDPAIAQRILECIGLPARAPPAPPTTPGRDPGAHTSQSDEDRYFDQTPRDEDSWA